jgi:predicted hydrolase (HD superfamily)
VAAAEIMVGFLEAVWIAVDDQAQAPAQLIAVETTVGFLVAALIVAEDHKIQVHALSRDVVMEGHKTQVHDLNQDVVAEIMAGSLEAAWIAVDDQAPAQLIAVETTVGFLVAALIVAEDHKIQVHALSRDVVDGPAVTEAVAVIGLDTVVTQDIALPSHTGPHGPAALDFRMSDKQIML